MYLLPSSPPDAPEAQSCENLPDTLPGRLNEASVPLDIQGSPKDFLSQKKCQAQPDLSKILFFRKSVLLFAWLSEIRA